MNTVPVTTFEIASTIDRINLWLASKNGPVVESFPHTHLVLPENHFSTFIEGWYLGELYGMQAVSEAIMEGEITLPTGIRHEMFSHCEMYFYKESN